MTNQQLIAQVTEVYHKNMLMDNLTSIEELCTNNIKVIVAFVGKNPKSPMYGKIVGHFTYKNQIFKFLFHIHKPKQRYAALSNKMTDLQKVKIQTVIDEEFVQYEDTDIGSMAFWEHTPLDYLKEQDTDSYE